MKIKNNNNSRNHYTKNKISVDLEVDDSVQKLLEEIKNKDYRIYEMYRGALLWRYHDWPLVSIDESGVFTLESPTSLSIKNSKILKEKTKHMESMWLQDLERDAIECYDLGKMALKYEVEGRHAMADHYIKQAAKVERQYIPTPKDRCTWSRLKEEIKDAREISYTRRAFGDIRDHQKPGSREEPIRGQGAD